MKFKFTEPEIKTLVCILIWYVKRKKKLTGKIYINQVDR